jgi:flagellar hook-length control protein FliK
MRTEPAAEIVLSVQHATSTNDTNRSREQTSTFAHTLERSQKNAEPPPDDKRTTATAEPTDKKVVVDEKNKPSDSEEKNSDAPSETTPSTDAPTENNEPIISDPAVAALLNKTVLTPDDMPEFNLALAPTVVQTSDVVDDHTDAENSALISLTPADAIINLAGDTQQTTQTVVAPLVNTAQTPPLTTADDSLNTANVTVNNGVPVITATTVAPTVVAGAKNKDQLNTTTNVSDDLAAPTADNISNVVGAKTLVVDNKNKTQLPTLPVSGDQPISDKPTETATLNGATIATQTAPMHTVAQALPTGKSVDKQDVAKELAAISAAQTSNDTQPIAPTTTAPITTNKINSEAINAQPQLAMQGNAMEKAVTHQVQRALIQQLPTGERMMVLRLTPPELGTVKIEVIERGGVFSARLHAEDDGVRLALERFLPSMRADLRASDAPIREITLSDQAQFLRSFNEQQQQQQSSHNQHAGEQRTRANQARFSLDGIRLENPQPIINERPLAARISSTSVDVHA